MSIIELPFRPRARLLQLLGDQLIGSPRLAVFELVKNAFDADAGHAIINIHDPESTAASISVEDDGEGMSLDIIKNIWLVPGHDHREKQRRELVRTPRFHRLPLGEKGLGRFAAHKLGNTIRVVTRAANNPEHVVSIRWNELLEAKFLEDAPVTIETRKPEIFKGSRTGTSIVIGDLRDPTWTRGEVRRLYRQVVSVSSPFEGPEDFKARLLVPDQPDWVEDLPDIEDMLKHALWVFTFTLEGGDFRWKYEFRPRGLKLDPRKEAGTGRPLLLPSRGRSTVVATADTTREIGPIRGRFYIFDRDRDVLRLLRNAQQLNEFLDEQGGIRIYRDGIRVYNYGEPTDDWLGLDLRRVNKPTRGISRNLIIGTVELSLAASTGLIEKTNREGFVENETLDSLKDVVLGALATFEAERKPDKDRLRLVVGRAPTAPPRRAVESAVDELREALQQAKVFERFAPLIDKIERNYTELKENLLRPSATGLNLAIVFHEVERGVRALHKSVSAREAIDQIERQARDLMQLLDGFSILLRRDDRRVHTIGELAAQSIRFNRLRFEHHLIELVTKKAESKAGLRRASFSMSLALGATSNLIDNAIYWMRVRWPEVPKKSGKPTPRRIFVGPITDLETGGALIVADTGPGLQDDPTTLIQPFFTRRPDGMGLGLYYANLVMELCSGKLTFPSADDVDLPDGFDGALVALEFQEVK